MPSSGWSGYSSYSSSAGNEVGSGYCDSENDDACTEAHMTSAETGQSRGDLDGGSSVKIHEFCAVDFCMRHSKRESKSPKIDGLGKGNQVPRDWMVFHDSGVGMTRLLSRYRGMRQCLPPRLLEVADFCISGNNNLSNSDKMYEDIGGLQLIGTELKTLEIGVSIAPGVINAMEGLLMEKWIADNDLHKICLDVVEKEKNLSETEVVRNWLNIVTTGRLQDHPELSPTMVFVPMFMGNHYNLLAVNLQRRKCVCFDTVYKENRTEWDAVASFTVGSIKKFLRVIGSSIHARVDGFNFEVINPPWSKAIEDPDSGLTALHLMEYYDVDGAPSSVMCLNEEQIRDRMRISVCATIVTSCTNLRREEVLAATNVFVEQKLNQYISPTVDIQEFRSRFDWMPSI